MQEYIEKFSAIRIGSLALGALLSAVLTFVLCLVVIRVMLALIHRALSRTKKLGSALGGFLESAVKIALWVLTVIIVADILGIPTASLVALVSVAGLALSLSVQNIMANLFSGITLLVTKPFEVGNFVDISGKSGTVKSVGLFYTVLDTPDNTRVSIPNGDVTSAALTNYSAEPIRRVEQSFCVSYDAATETVRAAILDAARSDERILAEPAPFVAIREYKDSSIEFISRVWCSNADYWDVFFGMNERVRESLAEHKVEITYNHLNVHLDKLPE